MTLSRHFYPLDDVGASLFYTTRRVISNEALFWSKELIDSTNIEEAISVLFRSWLWNTGVMNLYWLIDAYKTLASTELTEQSVLLSTFHLASMPSHKRDSSLWSILVLTLEEPHKIPDRVTKKTPPNIVSDNPIEMYFIRAIYQGKARCAWWISQYMDDTRIYYILIQFSNNVYSKYKDEYTICLRALQEYENLLGYKTPEYDIITKCMSIMMFCIHPKQQEISFKALSHTLDTSSVNFIDELDNMIGRRVRRIYTIKNDAIYGITQRGRSDWNKNNVNQLYNIEKYLLDSPFWKEVLQKYGTIIEDTREIQWFSDDSMEDFYSTYFPDDIPDEWDANEKMKSHGIGCLAPKGGISLSKCQQHLINNTCLTWNTKKRVQNYTANIYVDTCDFEVLLLNYKSPIILQEDTLKKLNPVRKIKIRPMI